MEGLFILIMPALILVWFIIALNDFFKCPKDDYRRQKLKTQMIIPAVILGIMLLTIIVLIIILPRGFMHM